MELGESGKAASLRLYKQLKEAKNWGVRGHKYRPFEQNDGGFYFCFLVNILPFLNVTS